ncbi:MAG: hypothetical protein ACF8XB_20360 [Planctomycetota bacterium JB042]
MAENQDQPELEEVDAPVAPEPPPPGMPLGAPPPPPRPPSKAFPQLFKFMWGGIIVAVGSILPFGTAIVSSMYGDAEEMLAAQEGSGKSIKELRAELAAKLGTGEAVKDADAAMAAAQEEPELVLPACPGYETFTGALFLLLGVLLFMQMRTAIAERRVALGAVLLMLLPAGWSWFKFFTVATKVDGFSWDFGLVKLAAWERLAADVGSGYMLVLIGSTYVAYQFLKALFGAAAGGKKDAAPAGAPAAAGGRGGRSGSRRSR